MAAEAEAAREARANVIAAEGEQKAAHALAQAANIIAQSPAALQVKKKTSVETSLPSKPDYEYDLGVVRGVTTQSELGTTVV